MKKLQNRFYRAVALMLVASLLVGAIPHNAYAQSQSQDGTQQTQEYSNENIVCYYSVVSAWGNCVNASVDIVNHSDKPVYNWELLMEYDAEFDNIWNADVTENEDGICKIKAKEYNAVIKPGESTSFGFIARGDNGKPEAPRDIRIADESGEGNQKEDEPDNVGEYDFQDEFKGLEYAVFTSAEAPTVSMNTNQTTISGDVHFNSGYSFTGNTIEVNGTLEAVDAISLSTSTGEDCQKISNVTEYAAKIEMPDITEQLDEFMIDAADRREEDTEFGSDTIFTGHNIFIHGNATFHATSLLGRGIVYATDSLTYHVGSMMTDEDSQVFLASKTGDITINGGNINLNAVLYAPNGTVVINANEFHLNGRIIAEKIRINGTIIEINAGNHDYDMISELDIFRRDVSKIYESCEDFQDEYAVFHKTQTAKCYASVSDNSDGEGVTIIQRPCDGKLDVDKSFQCGGLQINEKFQGNYTKESDEGINQTYTGTLTLDIAAKTQPVGNITVKNKHAYAVSDETLTWKEAEK